jgi:hypothetical protein
LILFLLLYEHHYHTVAMLLEFELLMLALEQVDVFTLLLNTTTVVAQNS